MANVLTVISTVSCPHKGNVTTPIASQSRLSVSGNAVLTAAATLAPIAGCKVPTSPQAGTVQCLAVAGVTAGSSTRLTVSKTPVLLDTLGGTTTGAPPQPPAGPPVTATAGQTRLTAV